MDNKVKHTIGYIILILLFSIITIFVLNYYNILIAEETTAKVAVKKSEKSLYSTPRYYLYTASGDTGISKLSVNKELFLDTDEGNELEGYQMGPSLYTKDGLLKTRMGIGFLLIVFVALVIFGVRGIISLYSKQSNQNNFGNILSRLFTFKRVSIILVLIVIFYSGKFAMQYIEKSKADEHTDARITHKDADFSGGGYRSIGHTQYTLSLEFEDQSGKETNVIQTVYKKTYDEYAEDDYIPITFQKDNPYNVFLPERGMFDWFYFTPNMIYIYILLAFVLSITGSVLKGNIKEKRKRKKDKNRRQAPIPITGRIHDSDDSQREDITYKDDHLEEWYQAYGLTIQYEENPDPSKFNMADVQEAYNIVEGRKVVHDDINLAYLWETFWKCGIWSGMFIVFFILIKEFSFIWIIVPLTILFPFSKLVFDKLVGFRMRRKINLSPKWRNTSLVDNLYIAIDVCLFFLTPILAPFGILYLIIRSILK